MVPETPGESVGDEEANLRDSTLMVPETGGSLLHRLDAQYVSAPALQAGLKRNTKMWCVDTANQKVVEKARQGEFHAARSLDQFCHRIHHTGDLQFMHIFWFCGF